MSSGLDEDTNWQDRSPSSMEAKDMESEDLMVSECGFSGPDQHNADEEVAGSAGGGDEASGSAPPTSEGAIWNSGGAVGE
jgi:hypothetical protein